MSESDDQLVEEITRLIRRAVTEDVSFYGVIADVERAVLRAARRRHRNWHRVHLALRIPKSTLWTKRDVYSLE